jgi:hypothetical protein
VLLDSEEFFGVEHTVELTFELFMVVLDEVQFKS